MPSPVLSSLDALFRDVMPAAEGVCIRSWCKQNQIAEQQVLQHAFVDEAGHAWSFLSWAGFQVLSRFPKNTLLLVEALELYREAGLYSQGLTYQTHPGEPDLLWAWLGHYSVINKPSQDSFYQTLSGLFSCAGLPLELNPDGSMGGWVLQALGMLESHAKQGGPHDEYFNMACSLVRQLIFSPRIKALRHPALESMGDLMPKGERIPQIGSCIYDAEVLKALVVPLLDQATRLLRCSSGQRNEGTTLLLYLQMKAVPEKDFWKDVMDDFGAEQWSAMKEFARAGLVEVYPEYRAASCSAAALLVFCEEHLTAEEELKIHHRLTGIPLYSGNNGEPDATATLARFHDWEQITPLSNWLRITPLNRRLPPPVVGGSRPRF